MTNVEPTAERIIEIIRRDLKLGPDLRLAPATVLFGGDLDLDSLDALLLVQSAQKEFGVRVPTDAIGPDIFATIETFTRFLQSLADGSGGATAPSPSLIPSRNLLDVLPHRPPFRFITGGVEVTGGGSGRAIWSVTGDESFFEGHFPGHPVVPGVLLGEALAQLCGLILIHDLADDAVSSSTTDPARTLGEGKLAHLDLRFERMVEPPADIVLEGRRTRAVGTLGQFDVRALVGAESVAHGSLALAVARIPMSAR